jgi:hypothetical protein
VVIGVTAGGDLDQRELKQHKAREKYASLPAEKKQSLILKEEKPTIK